MSNMLNKEPEEEVKEMKKMELKDGTIYLDGEEVEDLIEFKISSSAKEEGIAELDMKISVVID